MAVDTVVETEVLDPDVFDGRRIEYAEMVVIRSRNAIFTTVSAISMREKIVSGQSAKTSRVSWMKKLWSWPLFGSSGLYLVLDAPSGTCSSV